ncbi:MAG: SDR family oxidoreductase [Methylophilaceae bacterium]|nr:SDR family oxidoreductase [Methylophilaceae bacterium]
MKIAWITGGRGFIGRNLSKHLTHKGLSVYGIGHGTWSQQDYSAFDYQYWLNAEVEEKSLNQLVNKSGVPEVIFHLAGGSAVGQSIEQPYEDFQRTVDTTARLLEWVRQVSPETKVIGVSSAAVYGAGFSEPIMEDAIGHPYSPYGFHKSMLESLFSSYRETFDLNVAVVRLFSVYGAGLEKQLLWDICNKLDASTNGKVLLNGTGDELRDWLHVVDAAKLLWLVAGNKTLNQPFINGGTGIATSIQNVAQQVVNAWGGSFEIDFSGIARKGDPESLVADITIAKSYGFSVETLLIDGVSDFVHWFKAR